MWANSSPALQKWPIIYSDRPGVHPSSKEVLYDAVNDLTWKVTLQAFSVLLTLYCSAVRWLMFFFPSSVPVMIHLAANIFLEESCSFSSWMTPAISACVRDRATSLFLCGSHLFLDSSFVQVFVFLLGTSLLRSVCPKHLSSLVYYLQNEPQSRQRCLCLIAHVSERHDVVTLQCFQPKQWPLDGAGDVCDASSDMCEDHTHTRWWYLASSMSITNMNNDYKNLFKHSIRW